ncbi:class I SAM-dependent methyltransferase [uncultured Selenomonas sp.]|uniref:class I SAM-dependent methyltransferase n=1 Tax=uncultured Selenomonas sp. TaxID=159275 RepID=UPI0025D678AE|nr:class I SAM-dependent methyltransferase [uncultured Selenomonas sp.]
MYYQSIELYEEPRQQILPKLNVPEGEPEMSSFESAFLCGVLRSVRPRKILEVGVAGGGTTAIIMQCMELLGEPYALHSVDLAERFYRDDSKASGYLAEEAKLHLPHANQKTYLGRLAIEQMEDIGGDIDVLVLDTVHCLPGEVLDFLTLLPYLRDGAVVVLHDLVNNFRSQNRKRTRYSDAATATKYLFDSVVAETKYFQEDPTAQQRGGFPNIGAFRVSQDTRENIATVVSALSHTWLMLPSEEQLRIYRAAIIKMLDEEAAWLFDSVVKMNRAILTTPMVPSKAEMGYWFLRKMVGVPAFDSRAHKDEAFIVYGAGTDGMKYMEQLLEEGVDSFQICDKGKSGQELFHRTILRPQDLACVAEKDIVIASSKYAKEIYAELSAQGVEKARLYLAY